MQSYKLSHHPIGQKRNDRKIGEINYIFPPYPYIFYMIYEILSTTLYKKSKHCIFSNMKVEQINLAYKMSFRYNIQNAFIHFGCLAKSNGHTAKMTKTLIVHIGQKSVLLTAKVNKTLFQQNKAILSIFIIDFFNCNPPYKQALEKNLQIFLQRG